MKIGVIHGVNTIGGMEAGALQLAEMLNDFHDVWFAVNQRPFWKDVEGNDLGGRIAGTTVRLVDWNDLPPELASSDAIIVGQWHFMQQDADPVLLNQVPMKFEMSGVKAELVPAQQAYEPDFFIATTMHVSQTQSARRGLAPNKFITIPGIPVPLPELHERKEHGGVRFLSVCRHAPLKDLETMIRAFMDTPGETHRLIMVGDGPTSESVRALAESDKRIRFAGFISDPAALDTVYRRSDCFVQSSLWEGSSRSLKEAMSHSLPIVTTRVGGTPELVRHLREALLFKAGDVTEMAYWMQNVVRDADLRARLGENARCRIEDLNASAASILFNVMARVERGEKVLGDGETAISVIMPAFNAQYFVAEAVESIMQQDGAPPFELVVVDGGSSDETASIARMYAAKDVRIRVISTEHRGVVSARNLAAEASRGFALLPVDSDDRLSKGAMAALWKAFSDSKFQKVTYGNVELFDDDHEPVGRNLGPYNFDGLLKNAVIPVTVLHPKRAWMQIGGWDAEFEEGMEDWDYNIRLGINGFCGLNVGITTLQWRQRTDARSKVMDREALASRIREKHARIYQGDRPAMCCGKAARRMGPREAPAVSTIAPLTPDTTVVMKYVGGRKGGFGAKGFSTSRRYRVPGAGRTFEVHASDVQGFKRYNRGRDYEVVGQ